MWTEDGFEGAGIDLIRRWPVTVSSTHGLRIVRFLDLAEFETRVIVAISVSTCLFTVAAFVTPVLLVHRRTRRHLPGWLRQTTHGGADTSHTGKRTRRRGRTHVTPVVPMQVESSRSVAPLSLVPVGHQVGTRPPSQFATVFH
mmetsp:Transcript_32893/g.71055  ORF Transcript_32893/g.71055 Transcript_32893/m.71055 type:complete len:143 (-) Transcript_32893:36-464(-)